MASEKTNLAAETLFATEANKIWASYTTKRWFALQYLAPMNCNWRAVGNERGAWRLV